MQKRVLITGGAGFIGSHLARRLLSAGYRVRVLDNFSTQVHGSSPEIPKYLNSANFETHIGDVCSLKDLSKALDGVNYVYHFAASVGVGQSMYEVKSYITNNNFGTANLLQYLIEKPIEKLIVASSMSLYGEGLYRNDLGVQFPEVNRDINRLRSKEWEPTDGTGSSLSPLPTPEHKRPDLASIYALSKFDQEQMCLLVGKAYKIPTVALRFFNVYGPGQSLSNPYTGVMAIFASRLLNENAPIIFEDGNQKRDFVHVSDVTEACLLALENEKANDRVFNVGSGSHYTVKEIAVRMAKSLKKSHIGPEITHQYRVGDIRHCFADISLAAKILGYKPRTKLSDGIEGLTEWLVRQRVQAVDRYRQAREELNSRGLAI